MTSFLDRVGAPGACLFGTWVKIPSLEMIELLAHAGFDFVVIDLEHAPHTFESCYRSIVGAQGFGMAALVRLPDSGGGDVQRVLDSGADGVLVPRVRSVPEAEAATGSMLFAPRGSRGLGITSRAGRWGLDSVATYVARGDAETLRAMQLEDPDALRDAAAIIAVEGVNAVFVGLGDLALVTGRPATHPETEALVDGLLAAARMAGVPCGTAVADAAAAKRARDRGFAFVMISNDATLFGRAAADLMRSVRE
jgi:2-keto-3-deoxy-L-rhamnonate aldolase RhmA